MAVVCLLAITACSSGGGEQQETVSVPDVIGQAQAVAEAAIRADGLTVGTITEQSSDTVPSGNVINQSPAANSIVASGSSVSLVVSTGPANVAVPGVVGLSEAQATADITVAGLVVGNVTRQNNNTVPADDVISQDPVSGTMLSPGSSVDIVVSMGPATVPTPDVVGLSQAQATANITTAGLVTGSVTQQNDNAVPAGDVISQDPVAGTMLAPGSAVDLVVSIGPASIPVPAVIGQSEAAATITITGAGLSVGAIDRQNDDVVPAGDVISQDPTAGTMVAAGTSVDLVVSLGPPTIPVPDVVGLTEAQATFDLFTAGLSVGTITRQNNNAVPAGNVISQDPVVGTMVSPGSAVDLVISLGPGSVAVPDVTGLTTAQATETLINAGLNVGVITGQAHPTIPAGSVISQAPIAGAMVSPGTAIDLTVSLGIGRVNVPNVVGMTEIAAEAELAGVGLLVGDVTDIYDDAVPAGNVISQDPVAGTEVDVGFNVDLTVSLGPPPP